MPLVQEVFLLCSRYKKTWENPGFGLFIEHATDQNREGLNIFISSVTLSAPDIIRLEGIVDCSRCCFVAAHFDIAFTFE